MILDQRGMPANAPGFEKGLLTTLESAYPGYSWAVRVRGGMIGVQARALSGCYGYEMRHAGYTDQKLILAAGEILERYNMRRGTIDADEYANAKRNYAGAMVADGSQ